jgi:hypothetical protein
VTSAPPCEDDGVACLFDDSHVNVYLHIIDSPYPSILIASPLHYHQYPYSGESSVQHPSPLAARDARKHATRHLLTRIFHNITKTQEGVATQPAQRNTKQTQQQQSVMQTPWRNPPPASASWDVTMYPSSEWREAVLVLRTPPILEKCQLKPACALYFPAIEDPTPRCASMPWMCAIGPVCKGSLSLLLLLSRCSVVDPSS